MSAARKCLRRSSQLWKSRRLLLGYGFVALLVWCTLRVGSLVHTVHTYGSASAGVLWLHSR